MEPDPLCIILVKSDSKGDRLLFRYPFTVGSGNENGPKVKKKNPYAMTINEDLLQVPPVSSDRGFLIGFSDEVLSNLFAVKQELCNTKFELKVNDVRFVGHPTLIQPCTRNVEEENRSDILVNIVIALKATASHSIVKCYYDLSKRLGVALRAEEERKGYFSLEMKSMIAAHDDVAARPEESENELQCVFDMILEQCSLARDLKKCYEDLCSCGLVRLKINRSTEVSFCLPQKVHQLHNKALVIEPETIERCLQNIAPFHGLLLLVKPNKLLNTLAPDSSPTLTRLLKVYSPLKSLQCLSADSDLALAQVSKIAGLLVYWGKAIFIYPLCENNVYMTAPNAPVHSNSPLTKKFISQFPGQSLIQVLSDYSFPISIRQKLSPLGSNQQEEVQIIVWLLQNRLLIQLHTYIYFMPTSKGLPSKDPQESGLGTDGASPEGSLSGSDSSSASSAELSTSSSDILYQLSPEQRAPLLEVTNVSQDDLRLLIRLIQQGYLNGEHHLESIMYKENLRRSHVLQLIDKFRDVLITCQAEDPTLSIFYPHFYS